MEYCIQPVAKIINRLWDPTARRVNYFAKIGENNDKLQNGVKDLTASRDDLKIDVARAKDEGKLPTNEVQGWLEKADEIIENAQEMEKDVQRWLKKPDENVPSKKEILENAQETEKDVQPNNKCWCLDCRSRYKLGKRIVKAIPDVQNHMQKKNFNKITVPRLLESVQELPTTTIREGISTIRTLDQVWNWLMDAKTPIIGIWGKGGVGKTTLMKNINNKLRRTRHFEVAIFVTVSRDWNIKNLRNDIGKKLDLDLSKEEDEEVALTSLFNKLKGKRFLLILDDMWEKVDLDKLGVPSPKENVGCKIVITTRNKGVCNDMVTDEEIMVKVLSDTEAWELFREQAGFDIPSDVEPIAWDVCKECHGLPLAIIVVGRVLRKEADREVWEHALQVLKTSQFELEGMECEVYSPLKFSYDYLKTDTLRNCFLYCSLFPEDYLINVDRLIRYWTLEGLIDGVESLKDASAKGHYLLKQLIDSCLLEKDENKDEVEKDAVRMHDVIRDMAIKITSESTDRGRRFLVRAGVGLKECPEAEKWKGKDRISLIDNHIKYLPDEPKCTELSTLFLQGNPLFVEIPRSFFKQMKNLRVLDLSKTGVVSLPPSISELGGLQALILRHCESLRSVTGVGGLKQLQLLDLNCSSIEEVPREIGQLTRLRRLDLSETRELEHIPADIIVSLPLLEDLEMCRSRCFFIIGDKREALIENLGHLNHLSHFSADIPDDLCTNPQWEFLLGDKLKSFYLLIGDLQCTGQIPPPKRRGRYLDITADANVGQAVGLLRYADILRLFGHQEVRTISAMGARNLKRLKACMVSECEEIENAVITEEAGEIILPNLEVLLLNKLPYLRSIWEGNGTPGSFGRIKNITLRDCHNVMRLFSSNVLRLLNSLEELNIISCDRMVEIVTGEVGNGVIALSRLRRIVLRGLPNLNSMWEGVLSLGSLREIEVTSCTRLRQLAIDIEKTPALEVIKGEREWWDDLRWWDDLEWWDDRSQSHFQNMFKLVTDDDPYLYPEYDAFKYFF